LFEKKHFLGNIWKKEEKPWTLLTIVKRGEGRNLLREGNLCNWGSLVKGKKKALSNLLPALGVGKGGRGAPVPDSQTKRHWGG